MTEKSTTNITPGATEAVAVPDTETLAAMTPTQPEQSTALTMTGGGDATFLPTHLLRVTYGVGFGKEKGYPSGAFSLGTDILLTNPPKVRELLYVILAGYRTYWRDWPAAGGVVDFASLKSYATEEEAKANGRITKFGPYGSNAPRRDCAMGVQINMLVRQPKHVFNHLPFCILLGGERYALATMFVERSLFGVDERKSQVMGMLENLRRSDAADRKVHPSQGRLDKYFCKLGLVEIKSKTDPSKSFYNLTLNPMVDDDDAKLLEIGDDVRQDIIILGNSMANATIAREDDGEDLPF